MTADRRSHDSLAREAAVGRLGARLGALLAERAEALPHDAAERLRFGREQALARAVAARAASRTATTAVGAPVIVVAGGRAASAALGGLSWWQRLASLAPLALLVAGLMVIEQVAVHEQATAAAEFDAQLLADDLPPTAYSDPGFAEYLRSTPP